MKKAILTLAVTVVALVANAQLTVSKTQSVDVWRKKQQKLVAFISDADTSYMFMYRNAKYDAIIDLKYFSFDSKEELLKAIEIMSTDVEKGETLQTSMFIVSYGWKENNMIFIDSYNYFLYNKTYTESITEAINNFK
jgi:hypothetical protein